MKDNTFLWETEAERQACIKKYFKSNPSMGGLYGDPYRFSWSRESWELSQEYQNSETKLDYQDWDMNRRGICNFQI